MKKTAKSLLVSIMLIGGLFSAGAANSAENSGEKTVVLVHGAFADGSSWDKVIPLLKAKGLNAVAVQLPLSSLSDDIAATKRAIDLQKGPVLLVGHSWAGAVITEAGTDDKVKSLVYVTAFAPEKGQSVSDMLKGLPPLDWTKHVEKDSGGFLWLSTDAILNDFAPDLPKSEASLVAATQGPWFSGCADDKLNDAAWHSKPSWFVVTEKDRMISPDLQEQMAKRIGAKITRVDSSHVAMLSHPQEVADVIIKAAEESK